MHSGEEIITLQFGSFANFIGAHYFNIQEAGFSFNPNFIPVIRPDRLFRASVNISTGALVNFTPRTIFVDDDIGKIFPTLPDKSEIEQICEVQEGSLNLKSSNVQENQRNNTFIDDLQKSNSDSGCSDSPFILKSHYALENVSSWLEFNKTPLHQRSIVLAPKEDCLSAPLLLYNHGLKCSQQISLSEHLEDNVRFFAEECNNLQGFQIISEGHTAFSGIATSMLRYLKDEYGKKISIFKPAYFIPENTINSHIQISTCNAVSCLSDAKDLVDLIVPLSLLNDPWTQRNHVKHRNFKNIIYKGFDRYENSAILAAGIDLFTLPYRMREEGSCMPMSDYCRINTLGRSVVLAGTVIPFPTITRNLPKVLKDWNGPFFESISPLCSFDTSVLFDICYTFSKGVLNQYRSEHNIGIPSSEIGNKDMMENFSTFIQSYYSTKFMKSFFSIPNFRVPSTFPAIFNNTYNLTNPENSEYGRISEFQALGCLVNSREVESFLNTLHKRANLYKHCIPREETSEIDFNSMLENIVSLSSNYSETYDL